MPAQITVHVTKNDMDDSSEDSVLVMKDYVCERQDVQVLIYPVFRGSDIDVS